MATNANSVSAQIYQGVNISWGIGPTNYTMSGVTGIMQTADTEMKYDEMEIRNQRGAVTAWVGYNPFDTIILEMLAADNSAASGSAVITYPTQGTMISINADDPIDGDNWIVQSIAIRKTNADAAKITIKAIRYGEIQ